MPHNIDTTLVKALIQEQFHEYAALPVSAVSAMGNDNRTFHLGDDLLVRLPSAEEYAAQVLKEQKWLPFLRKQLSVAVPQLVAMGRPSTHYPHHWSIYSWLKGQSAQQVTIPAAERIAIAQGLARFLTELHTLDTLGAPSAGRHNFYRGGDLLVYDNDVMICLQKLEAVVDVPRVTALWHKACSTTWQGAPVWVHGDLASGNILIDDQQLSAVIDFGCMAVGDPACDLTIAWTYLSGESRVAFKAGLDLDDDTWLRAQGWALWKAMLSLCSSQKVSEDAAQHKKVISDLLAEKL